MGITIEEDHFCGAQLVTMKTDRGEQSNDRRARRLSTGCPKASGWSTAGLEHSAYENQTLANALIRADNRESFRATVLEGMTPLPAARCISGCAARNAS